MPQRRKPPKEALLEQGRRLSKLMYEHHVSMSAFAATFGKGRDGRDVITRDRMSDMMAGRSDPRPEILEMVCRSLGAKVEDVRPVALFGDPSEDDGITIRDIPGTDKIEVSFSRIIHSQDLDRMKKAIARHILPSVTAADPDVVNKKKPGSRPGRGSR